MEGKSKPLPLGVPDEYKKDYEELKGKVLQEMERRNGKPPEWSIKDFEIGAPMGRGKFGRVYLAREKRTQVMVALKMLFKCELVKCGMQHQAQREIEIQTHLKHPNVLHLLTYFHDEKRIYLVLEFAAGGELYRSLQSQPFGRFPENKAAKYTYQVADALHYCHLNNVIHRDIKPENLLLNINGDIIVADFGWSVHAPSKSRDTMCGTLDYLPPEMVERKVYNERVDNWCLGVLCYEFLVGKPPFESKKQEDTFKKIKSVAVQYPLFMPKGPKDLISKLLRYKPSERLDLLEFSPSLTDLVAVGTATWELSAFQRQPGQQRGTPSGFGR